MAYRRLINTAVFFLPMLGILFLYSSTWKFDFVWDDKFFFGDTDFFSNINLLSLFLSPLPLDFSAYYRPATQVVLALLLKAGNGSPALFHIFSTVVHLLNTALFTIIMVRICHIKGHQENFTYTRLLILFWSAFYAFHPVMVETVSWISSNFDLQMTFWLLTLICAGIFINALSLQLLTGAFLFFMACASKESCITFPFVCFALFCLIFKRETISSTVHYVLSAKRYYFVGIFIGGIAYFVLRYYARNGDLSSGIVIDNHSALLQVQDAMRSVFWYTKNLVMPFYGLSPVSDPADIYEFQHGYLYGGITLSLSLALLIFIRPLVAFAFIAFLFALLPVLHLIVVIYGPSFVSDRYMSYPLAIFAIAACTSLFSIYPQIATSKLRQYFTVSMAAVYIVAFITISKSMVPMWRDNISLWSLLYARHPNSTYAFSQLVASYGVAGNCDKVENLAANSGMRSASLDGAVAACIVYKDPKRSIKLVERALASDEFLADSQMSHLLDTMSTANFNMQNYDKSLEILSDVIKAYPRYHISRIHYVESLMSACKRTEADKMYRESLELLSGAERISLTGYYRVWSEQYDARCLHQ